MSILNDINKQLKDGDYFDFLIGEFLDEIYNISEECYKRLVNHNFQYLPPYKKQQISYVEYIRNNDMNRLFTICMDFIERYIFSLNNDFIDYLINNNFITVYKSMDNKFIVFKDDLIKIFKEKYTK